VDRTIVILIRIAFYIRIYSVLINLCASLNQPSNLGLNFRIRKTCDLLAVNITLDLQHLPFSDVLFSVPKSTIMSALVHPWCVPEPLGHLKPAGNRSLPTISGVHSWLGALGFSQHDWSVWVVLLHRWVCALEE
jgi:hypothetical protein